MGHQLGPYPGEKFMQHEVRAVLEQVMNSKLKDMQYDDAKARTMSTEIADEAKTKIKALGYKRYKIIIQTVIGQVKDQGAYVTSRCLWDVQKDNYASYWFKNDSLFCVCMVFGLYNE